eukprot:5502869-Amphidinium_carterae.1
MQTWQINNPQVSSNRLDFGTLTLGDHYPVWLWLYFRTVLIVVHFLSFAAVLKCCLYSDSSLKYESEPVSARTFAELLRCSDAEWAAQFGEPRR